jgi:hypothetical protein
LQVASSWTRGFLFYWYVYRVSVPIFSTGLTETPEVSGARSIVHAALFVLCFYLGFIRKWKSRSINWTATILTRAQTVVALSNSKPPITQGGTDQMAALPLNLTSLTELADKEVKEILTAMDQLTMALLTVASQIRYTGLSVSPQIPGLTEEEATQQVKDCYADLSKLFPLRP